MSSGDYRGTTNGSALILLKAFQVSTARCFPGIVQDLGGRRSVRSGIVNILGISGIFVCLSGGVHAQEGLGTGALTPGAYPLEISSLSDDSELTFDLESGEVVATNGVSIGYGPTKLTAEQMRFNRSSGWVKGDGNVLLQRGTNVWVSDSLSYNLQDNEIEAQSFRTGQSPAFIQGMSLKGNVGGEGQSLIAEDAYFTTDDTANPGYRVSASRVKVNPGEYIEARNATLSYRGLPIFWVPYYRQSLKEDGNRLVFTPGYRSRYGAYLESSYLWKAGEHLNGEVNLDYRTKRGIAAGPQLEFSHPEYGDGTVQYKHFWDKEPMMDSNGRAVGKNRYRFDLKHWWNPGEDLHVRSRINKLSDPFVHADYFEDTFRGDPQPKTFVEVRKFWDNFSVGMTLQPRLNTFFEQTERIPELTLSGYRQELGESGLYYETRSTLGYYEKRFADISSGDFSAYRADTYHQLLYPMTFWGWLNATPQAGIRATEYGKADGPGASTDRSTRVVADIGIDVSTKTSRTWRGLKNDFWDLRGLRHILQPTFHYVYVPDPSEDPGQLPQFDSVIPGLRLLPSHFPDFNSVDSLDGRHNLRMGLFQKVQTYRDSEIENFLNWSVFMDLRLDDRPGMGQFSDVYSDLDWRAWEWLGFTSEFRWDTDNQRTRLSDHRVILSPSDDWSWALGHRYIRNNDIFGEGNNLYSSSLYYYWDDNWSFNATHFFEARTSTLQEQIYSIYRDQLSFSTALRFRVRQPRFEKSDFAVTLEFSLKGFPGKEMGDDTNEQDWLLDY